MPNRRQSNNAERNNQLRHRTQKLLAKRAKAKAAGQEMGGGLSFRRKAKKEA